MISRVLAALVGCALTASPSLAEPLTVAVRRIADFGPALAGNTNGTLSFLGGLDVTSPDRRFGGLSGIDVTEGGSQAFFISDTGAFVRARLIYDRGYLAGLADAEIGEIFPGENSSKFDGDVEDVALDPAELTHGILVLERQADALRSFRLEGGRPADFASIPLHADLRILLSNRGLESVSFGAPGTPLAGKIVVIAERAYHNRGDTIPGWIVGEGSFDIVRHDDFDISAARFLPDGDLLLLERRFSPAYGLSLRLRRIPGATVLPGARLDGLTILDAGLRSQIDNMEGMSVHEDARGATILTLVSDDNFNILQRTLILQFALSNADAGCARQETCSK